MLQNYSARCSHAAAKKLETYRRRLSELQSRRVLQSPTGYIDLKRMEVDMLRARLLSAQEGRAAASRRRYVHLAASLDALSPLKVLSRGYAVAENGSGRIVRALAEVGETLRVSVSDGVLHCTVEEKEYGKEATGL